MLIKTNELPYLDFGTDVKRQVRIISSPYTTGEQNMTITHVRMPAGAISESHIHEKCHEYIYFDIGGKAVVDGKAYDVPPQGVIFARAGLRHECINNSGSDILSLLCVFTPNWEPYGNFPDLIRLTKQHLMIPEKHGELHGL